MKYIIIDLSTGQRLHETVDVKAALKRLSSLKKCSLSPIMCFIAKSNNRILGKVA